MLLFLLAPHLVPISRGPATLVFFAQIAALGLGQTRSVWVALPATLVASMLISRGVRVQARVIVWPLVAVCVLIVAGELAKPGIVEATSSEAISIVGFKQGHSSSDKNAEWRLSAWTYARDQMYAHPLTGVGFSGNELPAEFCEEACGPEVTGTAIHNSVLAMGERLGFPAMGMLLLVVAVIVAAGARARQDTIVRWTTARACSFYLPR